MAMGHDPVLMARPGAQAQLDPFARLSRPKWMTVGDATYKS
jgi:hypothetical protein